MAHHFKTPKIVPAGTAQRPWLMTFTVLVAVLFGLAVFESGRRFADVQQQNHSLQRSRIQQQLDQLLEERDQLRVQVARLERAALVDRAAVAEVQVDLKLLQQERAQLHKRVQFLQSLLSGDMSLLQINDLVLSIEGESNQLIEFNFTVSKRLRDAEKVRGEVDVWVSGEINGQQQELSGNDLGLPDSFKMGFSHFQKFEGQIRLPEGFEPAEMRVMVSPKGKKFKAVDQTFAWQTLADQ